MEQVRASAKTDLFDSLLLYGLENDGNVMEMESLSLLHQMLQASTLTNLQVTRSHPNARTAQMTFVGGMGLKTFRGTLSLMETDMVDPRLLEKPDAS